MRKIIKARARPEYTLELLFDDGVCGLVSLGPRLHGPMFEPLKDPSYFRQVFVDEFGAVCWPNNADLSPDSLYSEVLSRQSA